MVYDERTSGTAAGSSWRETAEGFCLQAILGTDKRNPNFTVYAEEERQELHVYYGLELLQVVPDQREGLAYKVLVGQLYNAGVKVRALQEAFGVDRKTMQRWGQALVQPEVEEFTRVMAGRQQGRKLTPAIRAYIQMRWLELQARGERRYRQVIQAEVTRVFGVRLSGETLRSVFRELRSRPASGGAPSQANGEGVPPGPESWSPEPTAEPARAWPGVPAEAVGVVEVEKRETAGAETPERAVAPVGAGAMAPPPPGSRQESPAESEAGAEPPRWCDHAGVLLFSTLLTRVAGVVDPAQPLFQQWLACILLGAVNVEQTKFLNWEDLSWLLGGVVRFPTPQRERLTELAREPASVEALLRFNAQLVGAEHGTDFYLDPHTKHYTGMAAVLKGWCPGIRLADKAMHADFIHTAQGHPLYFECTDNFADLRQRVPGLIQRFRQLLNWPERPLTYVIDRGIFGQEIFDLFLEDRRLELITWEKDYQPQPWPAEAAVFKLVIERPRNHARDVRSYHFESWQESWPRDGRLRRIVVRATNPQGRTMEVAILTTDSGREAGEIIRLMFSRWLQENDFKYLDKHFGINQITSYRLIDYAELAGQVQDRQVHSSQYQALRRQKHQLRRQQSALLLRQAQAEDHQRKRRQQRETLLQRRTTLRETAPEDRAALHQLDTQIAALERATRPYQTHWQQRAEQLQKLRSQLAELEDQIQTQAQEVSRLQELIAAQAVRPDTRNKRLMDGLKIIARNGFYQALQPFKKAYNNYRDDHDYFRHLTLASGILQGEGSTITVHLLLKANFSPRLRQIVSQCLEQLNQTRPEMPDGSQRTVRFRLAQRQDFQLIPRPPSEG